MQINLDINMIITIGSVLVGVVGITWRLSKFIGAFNRRMDEVERSTANLTMAMTDLKELFTVHQQELAKLEGMHEGVLKALMGTVSDLKTTSNKVDAFWDVLKSQDLAPTRLSDKRGTK